MEMSFSAEYWRRKELMETLQVPAMSELKLTAGLPLALLMFEECHPELQKDFGLAPPLKGPGDELWVSPSDLLMGKVALKPPMTQKHIQALTHQGIIEIGGEVEQKFLNEMRIDKENALNEQEENLTRMFEMQKTILLEEMRRDEQTKYGSQIEELRATFEDRIVQLLKECYDQVQQLEDQMQIEVDSLNILWRERLDFKIKETVDRITDEFLEKMRLQEQVLVGIFTKQIRNLKLKHKNAIEFERTKCQEVIMQLRHKLHCENIADLMYLLCKERKKCKGEKREMEHDFLAQIKKQTLDINKKARTIKKLVGIKNRRVKQLERRERCLVEILKQFHKFIYFALKAAPTQGEFLLDIHKLLRCEIEDYCRNKPQAILWGDKSTMTELEVEPPAPTQDSTQSSHKHDEEEHQQSDVLPAFYFNDKIYVREDFRDKLQAGVDLNPTDSLWNTDVEELIEIFKSSIAKPQHQIDYVKSLQSNVRFSIYKMNDSDKSLTDRISIQSEERQINTISAQSLPSSPAATPTMPLSPKTSGSNHKQMRRVSVVGPTNDFNREKRRASFAASKMSPKLQESEYGIKSSTNDAMQSRLTLARDSVILHISTMERKSLQSAPRLQILDSEDGEYTENEVASLYSEIRSTTSLLPETLPTQKKSSRTSKLLLANDSYELIKSTLQLLPENDQRKSQLTFDPLIVSESKENAVKATKRPQVRKKDKKLHFTPKGTPPRSAAEVVGSREMNEQDKSIDEFTNERIESLVHVIKSNPSLIRLFTSCSQ